MIKIKINNKYIAAQATRTHCVITPGSNIHSLEIGTQTHWAWVCIEEKAEIQGRNYRVPLRTKGRHWQKSASRKSERHLWRGRVQIFYRKARSQCSGTTYFEENSAANHWCGKMPVQAVNTADLQSSEMASQRTLGGETPYPGPQPRPDPQKTHQNGPSDGPSELKSSLSCTNEYKGA